MPDPLVAADMPVAADSPVKRSRSVPVADVSCAERSLSPQDVCSDTSGNAATNSIQAERSFIGGSLRRTIEPMSAPSCCIVRAAVTRYSS